MNWPGYIADEPWKYTYHYSLSPGYLRFACAASGLPAPRLKRYCELAYGQGISLAIHAAGHPDSRWTGTDFNPGHVAFAKRLATGAGLRNLTLHDCSLEDFSCRTDIEPQDFAALIGTWSWLPAAGQASVLRFLGDRLEPGGLFALHHSTLPGQNATMGLVAILSAFAGDGSAARIPSALDETLAFLELGPAFGELHWHLRELVRDLRTKPVCHLAHEYFNHNWRPDYFANLARLLSGAGLTWACHGALLQAIDGLNLTPRQSAFLSAINEPVRREQLRDFIRNSGGRTDLWSKGGRGTPADRRELMAPMAIVLVRQPQALDLKVNGGLGEVALSRDLYGKLIEALQHHVPMRFSVLADRVAGRFSFDEVIDAAAILIEKGMAQVANASAAEIERSVAPASALNTLILALAREGESVRHLCSPVTGAGIETSLQERLFLASHLDGARDEGAMARYAEAALSGHAMAQGLDARLQDRTLLERDAGLFRNARLPILRALRLVEKM